MTIVFLLIPLGFGLVALAVAALFWAVNSGQYDDLEDAGRRVLEPDESPDGAEAGAAEVSKARIDQRSPSKT